MQLQLPQKLKIPFALVCLLAISLPVAAQKQRREAPLGISGNQTIGYSIMGGGSTIEIPFESHNNLIVLPVVVNQRLPLKFILDSGVRTAILTEKVFSDMIQVNYDRKISLRGVDGSRDVEAYVASDVNFLLPGVMGQRQPMLVLKEDYLELKKHLGIEVHGILGFEIFNRFVVEIDYARTVIVLHEPREFKAPRGYKSLPITVEDTKPYVAVSITLEDGTKVDTKMLMDTGASHSVMLELGADSALNLPENKIEGMLGRGLGGDFHGHYGRVASVTLGKYELEEVISSFSDPVNYLEYIAESGRHGSLGGDFLRRFHVIFDYFHNKVYFRRSIFFKEPFEFDMSGLDVIASGPGLDRFVVKGIRKGSPADEAGIKVGDVILSLNRTRYRLSLNYFYEALRQRNKKRMRVKYLRNGEEVIVRFRLRRDI